MQKLLKFCDIVKGGQTMIYINGIRATKKDLQTLLKWIRAGKTTATAHTTKKGNLAIITEF